MIEWLSGSSRSEPKYASGDDGATFVDGGPETPAPLFVVRAFKTAIFGTPKPIEYKNISEESQQSTEQVVVEKVQVEQNPKESTINNRRKSDETATKPQKDLDIRKLAHGDGHDQLASPTKGILLTPGTTTTRRKTVSFSSRKEVPDRANSLDNPIEPDGNTVANGDPKSNRASQTLRKQSALTRTLIELSTKRSSPHMAPVKVMELAAHDVSTNENVKSESIERPDASEVVTNLTLDLNQPRSQSGQHWKAEYEEYHRKSAREMRKVIQYGRNVRSYAAKKDYEATNLNEKLQKELAKVARMETKVSKMAKQLKMATAQNPHGDSEQARLVGELAQQTAMTVRYQKKAEQYRKAMRHLPSDVGIGDHVSILDESLLLQSKNPQDPPQETKLQTEIQDLREIAAAAEKRAAMLEDENKRLKRSLARVKEEMATYDSKRQAKEERLKRRDERHKASKEACEAELAKLKVDYNALLQALKAQENSSRSEIPPLKSLLTDEAGDNATIQQEMRKNPQILDQIQAPQPFEILRKRRSKESAVDMWTAESPGVEPELPTLDQKIGALGHTRDELETRHALHDIRHNPTALESSCMPIETNMTQMQAHSENIRPHMKPFPKQEIAEDQLKSPFLRQRLLQSSVGKSASLLGSRTGSRTSTMGTARTSFLSAERTAAAKARLAERKRTGEKKGMQKNIDTQNLR